MPKRQPNKNKYTYDYIVNALEKALQTKKLITINDLCIIHSWHKSHFYNIINDFQREELNLSPSDRKITELHSLLLLKEEETLKKLCYQSPSSIQFLLKCNFGYDDRTKSDDKTEMQAAIELIKQQNDIIKEAITLKNNNSDNNEY